MTPIRKQIFAACLLLYFGLMAGFLLGRGARPTGLEIRRSLHLGWIEVYRGGELESEWGQGKDAELWGWLDKLLREDPSLYDPKIAPAPDAPPSPDSAPPGRGPRLFHQVRMP
jgi:hypothetical protein